LSTWESTTWIAAGASALAALALVAVVVLAARLRLARRRVSQADERPGDDVVAGDLARALERSQEETASAQEEARLALEEGERVRTELRWLRHLGDIGGTIDLEGVLKRALDAASRLGNAAAAMIVLVREEEEPLIATLGLSAEESSRELLGLPPEGGQARAVTLSYRYTEDEADYDEFRLRGGLAVPIAGEDGSRAGTLAIFWRRVEREITDEELARLEALTAALSAALENAFRFQEARRLADLDPRTGLYSRRYLTEALARECARARRYERRLALVLARLETALSAEVLATAGERLRTAVRGADIACHLDDGRFAVVLPEASLADAEHLYRRLQFAVGAKLGTNGRVRLPAGIVELRPEDDAVSLLERAEAALEREEEPGSRLEIALEPLT
jgi:diguanylate cyclase (GGDEF)-like protein